MRGAAEAATRSLGVGVQAQVSNQRELLRLRAWEHAMDVERAHGDARWEGRGRDEPWDGGSGHKQVEHSSELVGDEGCDEDQRS